MEGTFKPPRNLIFDKNVSKNIEDFLRSLEIYLKATGLASKDDETKIAIFLNLAGDEAQNKFMTFEIEADDRKIYTKVVDAFKQYCKPMRNESFDRYKFFTRMQQEGETFDHFVTDIKMLAANCNFGTLKDSLIRDKIVSGILNLSLQEKLLQVSNLTLEKAEDTCRIAEVSKQQMKEIKQEKEVDALKFRGRMGASTSSRGRNQSGQQGNNTNIDKKFADSYDCLKCGKRHTERNCPAYGQSCNICRRPNHFAIGCRQRGNNNKKTQVSASVIEIG